MAAVQEIHGWGTGYQCLGPRKQIVGVQETNGWAEETNGYGAQKTNGSGPGDQKLDSRKSMARVQQEGNALGRGNQ